MTVINGEPGVLTSGELTGSHTFAAVGTYLVHITVTDDDLGAETETFTLQIKPSAATAKFFVVDQSAHKTFRYDAAFTASGSTNLASGNSARRGSQSDRRHAVGRQREQGRVRLPTPTANRPSAVRC